MSGATRERRVQPSRSADIHLVTGPDELAWERPRRPPRAAGPETWLRLSPFAALLAIAVAGFLAFGPEPEVAAPAPVAGPAAAVGAETRAGRGFVLEAATWGVAEAAQAPPHPPPLENPTEWQVREEAFENAMRERLRGVEVFVRGRTR